MIGIKSFLLAAIVIIVIGNDVTARDARSNVSSSSRTLLRHPHRTLRAEDETSSSSSSVNVEEYMTTSSAAETTTTTTTLLLRQSTTSTTTLPYVSLPSFTLIVGPLLTLSSNTGSLLSVENNVAIRTNTLSGLQSALEYHLNGTLFTTTSTTTTSDQYHHWATQFEYASIDTLEYIQNVAAPGSNGGDDDDDDDGEYIAMLVTGGRIYFSPREVDVDDELPPLPSANEISTIVSSAITAEDKLVDTIRTLANGGGGGIAAQLYMCQTVSIVDVLLPTTNGNVAVVSTTEAEEEEVVVDESTSGGAEAQEIPTVAISSSSGTNPNIVSDDDDGSGGGGGTNPNFFIDNGGNNNNNNEEEQSSSSSSSNTNPNSSSSSLSSSSGTNPNFVNSNMSTTTATTNTPTTTDTPTTATIISMSPSTVSPTYYSIPTYPPTMDASSSASVSDDDGGVMTTTYDNEDDTTPTTTTTTNNNGQPGDDDDGATNTTDNGQPGDGTTTTIDNGDGTTATTVDNGDGTTTTTTTNGDGTTTTTVDGDGIITDNGDGTVTTDNGDGTTTTTTDNGDGGTTTTDNEEGMTTTTTDNEQQQQSGEEIGGGDVTDPTYSSTNDVDLSNIALEDAENSGMNKSMVMKGAIGGVLMGIVILGMIAVALFVRGKKRHRSKEMEDARKANGGNDDDGIKIAPMSTLIDSDLENGDEEDTDDGINFHSDLVNVNDTTAADDAYYNLCCAPRDAMQTPSPLTVDKEEDRAFDRLMTNALKACTPATKTSSEAPQLNCATSAATAAAGAAACGMAAGWTTSRALAEETDDDTSAEVVDDDSTSKVLPLRLRCHDSLHKMCPLNFDQICQKDPYGNINKEDEDNAATSAKNLVFDDIDAAYDLARKASIEREGLVNQKTEGVDNGGDDGIEELIRQAERRATTNGSDTASVDTKDIVGLVQAQLSQFNMKTPPRDTRPASPSTIRDSAPHDIVNNIKTAVAMKESSVTISPNEKSYLERPPSTSSTVPSTIGHEVRNIWFTSKEPEEEKYGIIGTINTAAKGNRSPEHLRNKSLPNVVTPTQSILRNTARYNASPVNVSRDPQDNDPPPSGSCFTASLDEMTRLKPAGRVISDENDSSIMGGSSMYDETVVHQLHDECESSPSTVPSYDFGLEERGRKARQESDTLKTKLESIIGRAARSMSPGLVRSGQQRQEKRRNKKDSDTKALISDDEGEDDSMSRPWEGKWGGGNRSSSFSRSPSTSPSKRSRAGRVSPMVNGSYQEGVSDGSNYDPDSDWDVDDTDVEVGAHQEDIFKAKSPTITKKNGHMRIW